MSDWQTGPIPEDGKYLIRISPAMREAFGLEDADLPDIIVDAKEGMTSAGEAPLEWQGPITVPAGL